MSFISERYSESNHLTARRSIHVLHTRANLSSMNTLELVQRDDFRNCLFCVLLWSYFDVEYRLHLKGILILLAAVFVINSI